jgi:hypothetical protein
VVAAKKTQKSTKTAPKQQQEVKQTQKTIATASKKQQPQKEMAKATTTTAAKKKTATNTKPVEEVMDGMCVCCIHLVLL